VNEFTDFMVEPSAELRPSILNDFFGQRAILDNLMVFLRAARQRGDALDHVLFHGPPGLGKTTLARIIATELNTTMKAISAPAIQRPADLAQALVTLQHNEVLFIDEIHRLPMQVEEMLYTAMEDGRITLMIGNNDPTAQPVEIPLPPFTLVGATTRRGSISQPMLDRFGMSFRLEYYDLDDLSHIVLRAADKLGEVIDPNIAALIAKRARGTPRIALKLLHRVRDFRQVEDVTFNQERVDRWLDALGLSPQGLDDLDMRYLAALQDQFAGKPVGLETMAAFLSEPKVTLETTTEPYLLRLGLIQKTPKGRILTQVPNLLDDK
jgi:Holliday junction DNA helicase RuvB